VYHNDGRILPYCLEVLEIGRLEDACLTGFVVSENPEDFQAASRAS
jgi:hypothetical protein